jgi:hypothetical protein
MPVFWVEGNPSTPVRFTPQSVTGSAVPSARLTIRG